MLLLAHVFPRTRDDSMGAFLLHLADALAGEGVTTTVIAPHAADLADEESIGSTRVLRFHYAPAPAEQLAYTGAMHDLVARGLRGKLLFALFNLALLWKTLRAVRAVRPQVLHAHWWLPGGLAGALVSMPARVPLVITTHGTDVEMLRRTRWARPLARFVFSRARAITCGSTYLREQLLALGVAAPDRVRVIPMPVSKIISADKWTIGDHNRPPSAKPNVSDGDGQFIILTVARLTAQKSIDTLITALAILRERGGAARLVIAGDGPERARLEAQARDLKLQECVEFLGGLPQTELAGLYGRAAVFALPSIREGMGLVFAEALLCGAPVIAANSGGVTDIVRNGETGLLVPERDPAALAGAIQRLLDDRALAARLAANGRAWVSERYRSEKVAHQFSAVYAALAAGRSI